MNTTILLVEDDDNDVIFVRHAFKQADIQNPLQVAHTSDQAIAYLRGSGEFGDRTRFPLPGLLILDVNTSINRTGFEVLRFVRGEPSLRHIIVVVWTSSAPPDAISEAYHCGANSFLLKPGDTRELTDLAKLFKAYWLEMNQPPPEP